MNEKERYLNPETAEDRGLIDSLLAAKRAGAPLSKGEPCPFHEEREGLIWAYADGFLVEEEEEAAWEEISQCRYCLERLVTIQRSLDAAEVWILKTTEEDRLVDQMKKFLERQEWRKVLGIYLQLPQRILALTDIQAALKQAVQALVSTPDFVLAAVLTQDTFRVLKPSLRPVMGRKIIHLARGQYTLTVESRLRENLCDLDITVRSQTSPASEVGIRLYKYETGIQQDYQSVDEKGQGFFTGISIGQYLLFLTSSEGELAEVFRFEIQDDEGRNVESSVE